jgi:hypothetical protein
MEFCIRDLKHQDDGGHGTNISGTIAAKPITPSAMQALTSTVRL